MSGGEKADATAAVVEAACAAILALPDEQRAAAIDRIADRLNRCGRCRSIGCGGWCDYDTGEG